MFSWFTREKNTIVVFVYFDGPQKMDENRSPGRVEHGSSAVHALVLSSGLAQFGHAQKQRTHNQSTASLRKILCQPNPKWYTKAARLEAALSALGDQESTAKAALQESLRQAKMEAKIPTSPRTSGGGNKSHQQAAICIAFDGTILMPDIF